MKVWLHALGVSLVLVFGVASVAHASFIPIDAWSTNDARITRDTLTGLDWLDLSVTHNVGLQDIRNGYGDLMTFGFRIATNTEARTFFTNAGADLTGVRSVAQYETAQLLNSLIGCTRPCPGWYSPDAIGDLMFQGAGYTTFSNGYGAVYFQWWQDGTGATGANTTAQFNDTNLPNHRQAGLGVFLVRSSSDYLGLLGGTEPDPEAFYPQEPEQVPEPSTLLMLSIGALAFIRRSKKSKSSTVVT
jgi:hypothetical protein